MKLLRRDADPARRKPVAAEPPKPPNVMFVHVPKCGGTSIKTALAEFYRPERIAYLDNRASKLAADHYGAPLHRFREHLLRYELERTGGRRLIMGHYSVDQATLETYADRWNFITVLRDPIARLVSHYFHNLHTESPFANKVSLTEFLDSKRGENSANLYARFLGRDFSDPSMKIAPESIDRAKGALERMAVIGILEDLPKFVADFETAFRAPLDIPHLNRAKTGGPTKDAFSEELERARPRLEELCAADNEIYAYGKELAAKRAPRITSVEQPKAGAA